MTIRPCVFTDEISLDPDEAARTCAEEGICEVQLRWIVGPNVVELPDEEVARIERVLRRYGLRVAGIASPVGKCPLDDPDAYHRQAAVFERAVRLADRLGARMIRVFAFGAPVDGADEFTRRLPLIAERLQPLSARAEREGLLLGLENEYTTIAGSCQQARDVIDSVGSSALRVIWDVASGWYTGEPVFPDGYERVRGLICDVHVRDARGHPTDPTRHGEVTCLGDGDIDYAEAIRRLAEDGYTGCFTIETHLYGRDPDRWPKLKAATVHGIRVLRRLLDGSAASHPVPGRDI